MLTVLVGVLAGVGMFGILGGIMLLLPGARGRVSSRVQRFVAAEAVTPAAPSHPTKGRRPALFDQLDARWSQSKRGQALAQALERVGVPLTVSQFILLRGVAAV